MAASIRPSTAAAELESFISSSVRLKWWHEAEREEWSWRPRKNCGRGPDVDAGKAGDEDTAGMDAATATGRGRNDCGAC